jgi:hypothetical protein
MADKVAILKCMSASNKYEANSLRSKGQGNIAMYYDEMADACIAGIDAMAWRPMSQPPQQGFYVLLAYFFSPEARELKDLTVREGRFDGFRYLVGNQEVRPVLWKPMPVCDAEMPEQFPFTAETHCRKCGRSSSVLRLGFCQDCEAKPCVSCGVLTTCNKGGYSMCPDCRTRRKT